MYLTVADASGTVGGGYLNKRDSGTELALICVEHSFHSFVYLKFIVFLYVRLLYQSKYIDSGGIASVSLHLFIIPGLESRVFLQSLSTYGDTKYTTERF